MTFHLDMNSLLKTAQENRDEEWEKAFLYLLPQANLKILEEAPKQGPDGFPYLIAGIDAAGTEPATKVLDWLSDKGIGLVLNPFGSMPDFVLTYGQIWNYRERNEINSTSKNKGRPSGKFKLSAGQKVIAGEPSEDYLPIYARNILREFFRQQGLTEVKIQMLGLDDAYDFCFSLESLKSPKDQDHRDLLEAISWFLPSHYSLALISEKGLPPFVAL